MEQVENSELLQLEQLPPEILHHIATFLSSEDICNLRLVSTFFLSVCDSEPIWFWFCKHQYGISLIESVSYRIYYQKFLSKYGKLIGLWQRQNVKFYSDLVCIRLDTVDKTIKFENLLPKKDVFENLTRKLFLTISIDSSAEILSTIDDAQAGKMRAKAELQRRIFEDFKTLC